MALTKKEILEAMIDGATLKVIRVSRENWYLDYPNGTKAKVGIQTGYNLSCMQEVVMSERTLTCTIYIHIVNS